MAKVTYVILVLVAFSAAVAIYNTSAVLSRNREDEVFFGRKFLPHTQNKPIVQKRLFHTAVTSSSGNYNRWQCRIMYYWFKKFKDQPGSDMGGFTRILHSGAADDLIDEIPTFVVNPLPDGQDKGYIVLHRPWAFVQWLQRTHINEDYILMAEPDHIFIKPLPNLALPNQPAAFPFFYITPDKYKEVIQKFFQGDIKSIDPVGNSPAIINKAQLEKIAPTWHNLSVQMKQDAQADKAFGWVLEMYAYAIASATHGVHHILHKDFMIQPPFDQSLGNNYILHYTYGCDYTLEGVLTYGKVGQWRFDKRDYTFVAPKRNLTLPPANFPESVVTLVRMINEATNNIPNWQ